jgi:HD-GYP domain-containing protein (c-di-GMP phosphodiesterase class II)
MIKKINVKALKPGMYIHDMNCGWLDHPFLSNSMKVKNRQIIEKIISTGIREVYIDTKRGLDVANAPTKTEVTRAIKKEISKITERNTKGENTTPVQEELSRAKEIKKVAIKTVKQLMKDIRLGKQLELEKVDRVVESMVDSIFRNDAALTTLGKIKQMDEYTYFHW